MTIHYNQTYGNASLPGAGGQAAEEGGGDGLRVNYLHCVQARSDAGFGPASERKLRRRFGPGPNMPYETHQMK